MHAVVDDARMLNMYINWFHLRFLVSLLLSADEPSSLVIDVEPSKNGKNVFCNTTNSNYSRETPKTARRTLNTAKEVRKIEKEEN